MNFNQSLFNRAMEGVAPFLNTFGDYITILLAFIAVTLIILFVYHATALAKAGDNPVKRQQAIHGIMIVGICLAILGSFSMIYGLLIAFIVV